MALLHLQFFSGNTVHGLSAVLPVEWVRVTCFKITYLYAFIKKIKTFKTLKFIV